MSFSIWFGRKFARMAAVVHRCVPSGVRPQGKHIKNRLEKKKEMPEMQVLILQLNKISGVFLEVTYIGIRLLQGRHSVPKDDFPDTSELQRSPETNEIKH